MATYYIAFMLANTVCTMLLRDGKAQRCTTYIRVKLYLTAKVQENGSNNWMNNNNNNNNNNNYYYYYYYYCHYYYYY